MNKNKDSRYYRTNNFYAASFLFSKGMELVNIDRTDEKRCQFVFRDTPERESLMQAFTYAKKDDKSVLIDARKLIVSIRTMKDKLYQNAF